MTESIPETILEPDLPIIDPHHHLWDLHPMLPAFPPPHHPFIASLAGAAYYSFDQLHADTHSGHNIVGTVFVECGAFYDHTRGEALKTVGEVEFVNGVAAQGASGLYGDYRPCAGIVGHADLSLGTEVGAVLDALQAASPRFTGIRHQGAWDADGEVYPPALMAPQGLFADARFREGVAELGKRGLTFDIWAFEPQLGEVLDLARAFPDQPMVLDHCGGPLALGGYEGTLSERFDGWRKAIRDIAACGNVVVKLGGLAMATAQMPDHGPAAGVGSEELAAMWKPYIDTCIEAFGAERAMFESNYPVDRWGASYPVLWNAFKRIASAASDDEKSALFAGNAARFYGLEGLAI
ncbi:amidohydrolase family protein [Sphingomonadaceae bacterium]|nr:amidohydrolase family protein [Sphingomonadaceae bacterium]